MLFCVRTIKPENITPEHDEINLQRLRREKFSYQESRELRGENKVTYKCRKDGAIGRK